VTSWVEVCRQRAIAEQAKAAVLSAEARYLATVTSHRSTTRSEFAEGWEAAERMVVGLVQRHAATAYHSARIWADAYRTALIEAADSPWMAAA
jgi:hypothetical protein